jgi:RNA polymerase sigma-70 factor (ECF subfamily)
MDPKKLSLQELLQLCLATQDPALWQEFVSRFQPLISRVVVKTFRRCRFASPDPALVDDLTQDTFMKLFANDYRALREFQAEYENSFFGFIKTVASHLVKDYIRKDTSEKQGGRLKREDLDEASITTPAPTTVTERAEHKVLIAEIQRCLEEQLAYEPNFSRDIAIFWLYYRYGLTAKAISQIPSIGLTVKGVESTLLRLTRLVRNCLGGGRGIASGR